tara:strand:- start:283 stop:447 length:165 start_codon:yes stop_codon:yes gene_type:complete
MSYIEDILYEARELGIYKKVLSRVKTLRQKHPHKPLNNLYDEAFTIENENKYEN